MLLFIRKNIWLCVAQLILLVGHWPLAGRAAAAPRAIASALTGQVRNKANQPLAGVVVALQGIAAITATNADGTFYVTYTGEAPVLVLKYAGYQTQTLRVLAKSPVGITLYEVGTPLLPQAAGIEMVIETVEVPDVAPVFSGGTAAYRAYIKQNLRYPDAAKAKGAAGTVLVGFVVDERGHILNAEIAQGVDGLNEEALRLVNLMPWWTPARKNGQPVRASSFLRIRFEYHTD
ncbi:MAG: TonB family protein [Hymenobacter sp.]|nr:MAG: TonB family protein [Hymenobacter sp.]